MEESPEPLPRPLPTSHWAAESETSVVRMVYNKGHPSSAGRTDSQMLSLIHSFKFNLNIHT